MKFSQYQTAIQRSASVAHADLSFSSFVHFFSWSIPASCFFCFFIRKKRINLIARNGNFNYFSKTSKTSITHFLSQKKGYMDKKRNGCDIYLFTHTWWLLQLWLVGLFQSQCSISSLNNESLSSRTFVSKIYQMISQPNGSNQNKLNILFTNVIIMI